MNLVAIDSFGRKSLGLAMILAGMGFAAAGLLPAGSRVAAGRQAREQEPGSQNPAIRNARLEKRAAPGGLGAAIRELAESRREPLWVGYEVERLPGEQGACCGDDDGEWQGCQSCELEKGQSRGGAREPGQGRVVLEGPARLWVLLRLEGKRIQRLQVASENCTLDAGGLGLVWLTGVSSLESLTWLESLVHDPELAPDGDRGPGQEALTAIALHKEPAADRLLASFASPGQPEELRKRAVFWMGAARGPAGLEALLRLARSDASGPLRSELTFALSVSREKGAVAELIRMAHDDPSGAVRGQALFWLGQKAGQRALEAITGAIQNDPDTEVKKRAVFALSQLPKDQGVPKLILVAESSKNPEVRKQAMFWLGQSQDPRAVAFFEKILSR